jgi:hypothetical protein
MARRGELGLSAGKPARTIVYVMLRRATATAVVEVTDSGPRVGYQPDDDDIGQATE